MILIRKDEYRKGKIEMLYIFTSMFLIASPY